MDLVASDRSNVYRLARNAFNLGHIGNPIQELPDLATANDPTTGVFWASPDCRLDDEEILGLVWPDSFLLLRDETSKRVTGLVDLSLLGWEPGQDAPKCQEVARTIEHHVVLPAELPIMDALPYLMTSDELLGNVRLLKRKNQLTDWISWEDLDSIPVKSCLATLFFEIESVLLEYLQQDASYYVGIMKPQGKEKAIDRWKEHQRIRRNPDTLSDRVPSPEVILEYSEFVDKSDCLRNSGRDAGLLDQLGFKSKASFDRFFRTTRRYGNICVHSRSLIEERAIAMNTLNLEKRNWLETLDRHIELVERTMAAIDSLSTSKID